MSRELVSTYYGSFGEREWERLTWPEGALEFAVTTDALMRFLPPSGHVLDIGGGPGRYTLWLAQRGYQVTLADLSAELIAIAQKQLADANVLHNILDITVADACDLSRWADESFDAVLSLGPFYHLSETDARERAAAELTRVLRPGGTAFVMLMPHYAFLRRTIAVPDERHHLKQPGFIHELMHNGAFFNDVPGRFNAGYGVKPTEIAPFFARYGLVEQTILACEGLGVCVENVIAQMAQDDPEMHRVVVDLIIQTASDPSIQGLSGHLLYVGKK